MHKNTIEDAFLVCAKEEVVKFSRTREGLCRCELQKEHLEAVEEEKKTNSGICTVITLVENYSKHLHGQLKRAKAAQKPYHVMGAPSIRNFKATLRSN